MSKNSAKKLDVVKKKSVYFVGIHSSN